MLGQIGEILGFEDYYFESECILCTRAFLIAAVSTAVNDGEYPPGSTEFNAETWHNCSMTADQYRDFSRLVLGLHDDTWAKHRTKSALRNMIRCCTITTPIGM